MLNLTENEKTFLKENFENVDELIHCDDIGFILEALNDLILDKGYDENQDITDEGRRIEKIYDNIYANN